MPRQHPKRNTRSKRFAMLPHAVLNTDAVRSLSHAAFRLMALFAAQYNGKNNGGLALTPTQAAQNGIRSQTTFYKALAELEERALIDRTFEASRVPPRPTMYALNWLPVDDTEYSQATRVPSHAFKKWTAPARKPRKERTTLRAVK